jgi:hypothetical protein
MKETRERREAEKKEREEKRMAELKYVLLSLAVAFFAGSIKIPG